MSPFWILLELRVVEVVVTTWAIWRAKLQSKCHHQKTNTQFLQAGCPSCCPANSVRALNGKWVKQKPQVVLVILEMIAEVVVITYDRV